jgi:transglutaminase-like putative cysteine protease
MELIQEVPGTQAYLGADEVIDHGHPLLLRTAAELRAAAPGAPAYARAAFDYVRDRIPHSADTGDLRVTWRASDVLRERTGICYAKAHALVALLRAASIPAGLCYQRLADDDGTNPAVHGLIALRLPGHDGWARQDPRGNRPGVDAQFSLAGEQLAWIPRPEYGERDYPVLYL